MDYIYFFWCMSCYFNRSRFWYWSGWYFVIYLCVCFVYVERCGDDGCESVWCGIRNEIIYEYFVMVFVVLWVVLSFWLRFFFFKIFVLLFIVEVCEFCMYCFIVLLVDVWERYVVL